MKTILIFIAIVSSTLITSCNTDDSVLNDEKNDLYDIAPVSPGGGEDDIEL